MKEILITTTVLILCILLIRRIFRGKISSRLQYALWLLVALRLMIPVSAQFDLGPLSDFRLMDLVEEDESGIAERLNETIRLEEPIQMTMDSRSILFRLFAADEVKEAVSGMSDDGPTSVFMAGRLGFSRLDVLWFVWGCGAFVVGVWILVTNIVFNRRLKRARQPFDLPEGVKIADLQGEERSHRFFHWKRRLPAFYLAEGISSPCLYGLPGREAVYLTAGVIDDTEKLRHVITHELVHKKHGDSFWAVLRSVLVTVYWFHPLVWVAAVCSKRDCELACDEGALKMLGEEERISYGETLLSIITRKGRASDLVCTATTMTGSGKSVKERIRFIADRPKTLLVAVAGVLVLTAAVCLFVFTRDVRFGGTIVDSVAGLTVTGADMQITLPASIGGISGCVVDKKSDEVVIYHAAAQEEVGRFARMPLKDALQLVDGGRDVLPIGDYGYNYLLRAYLGEPWSRTEHIYTPATQGVLGHEDIYLPEEDENPMLSEGWEVIPLEDELSEENEEKSGGALGHEDVYTPVEEARDYLPHEEITTVPADSSQKVTMHTYTPNESAASVPGTDSNDDDSTYVIEDNNRSTSAQSEESRDYLPNEEIIVSDAPIDKNIEHTYTPYPSAAGEGGTDSNAAAAQEDKVDYLPDEQITVTYQPTEKVDVDELGGSDCYVYVKANFNGKVKAAYREEMTFIDGELKKAVDQVIILSLNRERREALFDALTANRTSYVGDNAKVGALVDVLPLPPTLNRSGGFSLQTLEEPYSLRFDYQMSTDYYTKEDQDMMYYNAALLFYAIGNVEEIAMEIKSPSGSSTMTTYHREELEKDLSMSFHPNYEDDQMFRSGLSEVHTAAVKHLSTARRAYLSTESAE